MKVFHQFTRSFSLARSLILASAALVSVSATAMDFPLRADDIGLSYRYTTTTHWSGGAQAEARDIVARRPIGNDKWSQLKTDASDSKLKAMCRAVVFSNYFDRLVLLIILLNCIQMALKGFRLFP